MKPFVGNIENETLMNFNFRKVIFTGNKQQLVLMCLKPGEEIGNEIHENVDQFFRIEKGKAKFLFENGKKESIVKNGEAVIIPMGTWHNVINLSEHKVLQLYTIYSPPQHPEGTIQKNKPKKINY